MKSLLLMILCTFFACAKKDLIKSPGQSVSSEIKGNDKGIAAKVDKYVNVKDGLNVRSKPEKNAKKIATLKRGDRVKILAENPEIIVIGGVSGQWTQISAGKVTGWCFGGFLSEQKPPELTQSNDDENPMFNPNTNFKEYNEGRVQKCLTQCGGDSACERNCGDW